MSVSSIVVPSIPKPSTNKVGKKVIPVIIIALDQKLTNSDLARFKDTFDYIQDWYAYWVSKSFYFDKIVLIKSIKFSKDWISLSKLSTEPGHRWDFVYAAQNELIFNNLNVDGNIYLAMVYAGDLIDNQKGAGTVFNNNVAHAIIPPQSSEGCVKFTTRNYPKIKPLIANTIYAAAHELGHCFGLGHSCDLYKDYSKCWNSFMQQGVPPDMTMLPPESSYLNSKSEWFY